MNESSLDALSRLYGILPEYSDIWGGTHRALDETRIALLHALGALDEGTTDFDSARRAHETARWREILPAVAVFVADALPYRVRLHFPERHRAQTYRWTLTLEDGARQSGEFRPDDLDTLARGEADGTRYVEVAFDWRSALPTGYHRLTLAGPGLAADAYLSFIVAPRECYVPPALAGGGRTWGAAIQLYGVRSDRNWGMGDFTDLRAVVEQWGRRGAGVIGMNPLHALFPHNPEHASPYSPSSRLFVNVLYIDVEAIEDARECAEVAATIATPQFQEAVRAARAAELVDYKAVAALKRPLLERAYRHFREHHLAPATERGRAFRRFQAEGGSRLLKHALFEALQEHFHREDPTVWGWPVWPEAYRRPDSPDVTRFAKEHVERVELYQYLQWQAALQLERAGRRANELGFAVGVYQDLAISIDRGGAESWANQGVYAVGASVGAPPDELNLKGQNWGLPPLRPAALKAARYEPFIATLRANMKYSGALRLDHVMGLYRLYLIPPGVSAADGAYVLFPFDDLIAILALESQRNRCLVIGEDLGTVPDEVRAGLSRARVMSYRVLFFERNDQGEFKAPEEYPADALVAVSTHDLGTLQGYWDGYDLEVRQKLSLFPSDEVREKVLLGRAQERARLGFALERAKLIAEGDTAKALGAPMTPELARAVHAFIARTPSRVLVAQLEDILGVREQANMPGTVHEQPNWRRKLPLTLEEIEQDARFLAITETFAQIRPRPGPPPVARAPVRARIPRCTYRLQLSRDFTFAQATALIPYLARLGVSHVYCSPYLRARSGSTHGYDIIDHNALNPEIGTREDFEQFVATLRAHDMGHILDMVPNHMGVMGADNAWWLDVLENGPASAYADFFDIDWDPANPALTNKVLIAILGDQYGVVLERGELVLAWNAEKGELSVQYYDHRLPIDPREYPRILMPAIEALPGIDVPQGAAAALATLSAAFGHLPPRDDAAERRTERNRDKEVHKQQLARLASENPGIARAIERAVQTLNGKAGEAASFERLHALLEAQAYRLSSWRVAADEINYRRFFDINDLAALRMENETVFEATHRFVLSLAAEGKIDGLRIDHPDGLYDPEQYFRRLQQRYAQLAGLSAEPEENRPVRPLYVILEKIAASHERLPETWAVYGTSGYRFATVVNAVLVDHTARDEMTDVYRSFVEGAPEYADAVYQGKRSMMQAALAATLTVLATELLRIARSDRRTRDYTLYNLRAALAEIVACFPVYRTYIVDQPSAQDRRYIEWAVAQARRRSRAADATIFEFVRRMLLAEAPEDSGAELKERIRAFAMRVQQFTAPVTAKGVEDTAFYRYLRLVSLNDVGGDPSEFGLTVSAFHGAAVDRAATRPHTMLATSTHDNKRSEDVRARIDVISEMPEEWRRRMRRWQRMNRTKKTDVDGIAMPSANDEYLFYQTVAGTLPVCGPDADSAKDYSERIERYMLKAVREAKVNTSWINPSEEYENAVAAFVRTLLDASGRNLFLKDIRGLAETVAWFGMLNSLSLTVLKLTSPGVPDIYQGNETVDLSLVDPDSRRPVDYDARMRMLESLPEVDAGAAQALAETLLDGRAKMYAIQRTLAIRRDDPEVFERGSYVPLEVKGERTEHVIAFMRQHEGRSIVVVCGRLWSKLGTEPNVLPLGEIIWRNTVISGVPSGPLVNAFTGETLHVVDILPAAAALARFPCALFIEESP